MLCYGACERSYACERIVAPKAHFKALPSAKLRYASFVALQALDVLAVAYIWLFAVAIIVYLVLI